MRNFLYTILAVMTAACSAPAFAQGYVTDPKEVGLDLDFYMSDSTRCITATPFLLHKDGDFTAVLDVMLFQPKGSGYYGIEWTLELRVLYTNPDFGDGKDITRPFAAGDLFGMYVNKPYKKEYYIKENGKLNTRTDEWEGKEWLVANFTFDNSRLISLFKSGNVDMVGYTQGGENPFANVFQVSLDEFAKMMVNSTLAILKRLEETL
ncbi:MAG: hypothetical protein LUD72_13825 [Bacteroidales bacterium]|nr:hypothetical protein [Bacteroidales bacterium]